MAEAPGTDIATGADHPCDIAPLARAIGAVPDTSAGGRACLNWQGCRLEAGEAVAAVSRTEDTVGGDVRIVADLVYRTQHVRGGIGRLTTEYHLTRDDGRWRILRRIDIRVT